MLFNTQDLTSNVAQVQNQIFLRKNVIWYHKSDTCEQYETIAKCLHCLQNYYFQKNCFANISVRMK